MAVFPQKPRTGQKVLQGLYNSVCQIIDYLPTLEVKGDNSSTSVTKTSIGTIIHATKNNNALSQKLRYQGWHGVDVSNHWIGCTLTGGTNITVNYYEQGHQGEDEYALEYPTINCTLSGGGGGTTIVDNFGVPNLSALNYNNEALTYDGYGITWLIPVSAGQQFTYKTGASGNVNASYAPSLGKSGAAFSIERDVLSTIPQDGYVRITAFDDGSQRNQCLRVMNGNNWDEGLPIYRFKAPPSTVVPSGGRYIDVQQTSTRINPETEEPEIYTLSRPVINNTLSGGKYIEIQELDDYNVPLQYPLINCTLHGDGSTISVLQDGTISCLVGGGPGPGGGGFGAPDYNKLCVSPDAGESVSGLGTTYLCPVNKGSYVSYIATAGTIIARWAPVVGSSSSGFDVTTLPQTTPDDGYVRITVIDPGTESDGCVRLRVNLDEFPLHKFTKFSSLSGDNITINVSNNTISGLYTGDGSYIRVDGNQIKWIGTITPTDLSWKVGYPDYQALRNDDPAYANVSGGGTSWILPVMSGDTVKFYTAAGASAVLGTFAASLDQTYERQNMSNGVQYTPSANGWVRVSVFDDGTHQGECLRFYKNATQNSEGMPLYRFKEQTQKLSGSSTVGIVNNVISGLYVGDGSKIQVNGNQISWIGGAIGGGFKAPDYNKLGVSPDAGESVSGMGTTYLCPVSKGSSVKYSADGGTIIARWAPVEGSSENAFNLTTSNQSTPDDGYVRISVIDDGSLSNGCVRVIVNNHELPLHKFTKFNYSSGAIYDAGRYMDIQQTSTRINPDTQQDQTYYLDHPIINNMLTGGRFIEIQEEENNVALEYPRINCNITAGSGIEITTGGVINNTSVLSSVSSFLAAGANINLTTNQQGITTISAAGGGGGGITYTGIDPIIVNNNTHTISFNGSTTTGIRWPIYSLLGNSSTQINVQKNYTAGPDGGWLRVSYKGSPEIQSGEYCYSVYVDGAAIGLYTLNSALGTMGNTWLLPIPPFSQFMVNFPNGPTHAYFDGSTAAYDDLATNYATISGIAEGAKSELYYVKQSYNNAKEDAAYSKQQWDQYLTDHATWEDEGEQGDEPEPDSAETYYDWWDDTDDQYRNVLYHISQVQYFVTAAEEEYENMQQAGTDSEDVASWYVEKTYNYYQEAQTYSTKAQVEVNKAHRYYLSACNYWGVTPQDLPNKDE